MPRAKVTMKAPDEGFRYYRLDNVPVDLKNGQEFELDDIPARDRKARLASGHVTLLGATPAPAPVWAVEGAKKPKK